jgi:hypothetical protein
MIANNKKRTAEFHNPAVPRFNHINLI